MSFVICGHSQVNKTHRYLKKEFEKYSECCNNS